MKQSEILFHSKLIYRLNYRRELNRIIKFKSLIFFRATR